MTASKSRITVFAMWLGTLAACFGVLFLALIVRSDVGYNWEDLFDLAAPIASMYIPVLTSFSLFWFHPGALDNSRKLSGERWIAAFALTAFYQMLILGGISGIVLFSKSAPDAEAGLLEKVNGLIHLASVFSPLAIAPAAFLLGIEPLKTK